MRTLSLLAALGIALTNAPAQGTNLNVADVGLTVQRGPSTSTVNNLAGQRCGPFSCTPLVANASLSAITTTRVVRVYGDANSLYVLAMSTGAALQPCIPIPGIDNALILGQPAVAISIGVTGPPLPSTSLACLQGVATYQLSLPAVSPAVIPYYLQALTFSFTTQGPAFTVAVRDVAN